MKKKSTRSSSRGKNSSVLINKEVVMQDSFQKKKELSVKPVISKGFFQTLAMAMILFLVLYGLNGLFLGRAGTQYILSGQKDTETSYDVIFAGSSHMNNAVYPMILWEEYGFTSFNNAQSGEILPVSYYTCKEAIEKYHPKVLVLDVYMIYHSRRDGNISWMHQSVDRLSATNRIPAILNLVPLKNWEEFLFPLTLYHSRWKELSEADFVGENSVSKGCAQNFTVAEDIIGLTFESTPENVKVQPPEIPVEYLNKIVDLCKQTDTELLLVALPYFISDKLEATHDLSNDIAYFNWVSDFSKEKQIPYINYFYLVDEIGFDWWECLYNYSHMNYWGGSIITQHIGEYLNTHYNLPDRRKDPDYQHWNIDLKIYQKQVDKKLSQVTVK